MGGSTSNLNSLTEVNCTNASSVSSSLIKNFSEWAYANGYDENAPRGQCTIDRIDNNKGYSPDNCRWVTMKEQSKNKRNSNLKECVL